FLSFTRAATTSIYTLSLHDALPILNHPDISALKRAIESNEQRNVTLLKPNTTKQLSDFNVLILYQPTADFKRVFDSNKSVGINTDRKSTRLNSSHVKISYAVFCLKK